MKSMCHDARRNSPSVADWRPTSSCIRTSSAMASSSTARNSSGPRRPAANSSRASSSFRGRRRLPTWSARNGGCTRLAIGRERSAPMWRLTRASSGRKKCFRGAPGGGGEWMLWRRGRGRPGRGGFKPTCPPPGGIALSEPGARTHKNCRVRPLRWTRRQHKAGDRFGGAGGNDPRETPCPGSVGNRSAARTPGLPMKTSRRGTGHAACGSPVEGARRGQGPARRRLAGGGAGARPAPPHDPPREKGGGRGGGRPPVSPLHPLRLPAFRRLAGAYAISRLGDTLALVALAIAIYDQTGSTVAVTALLLALDFIPALTAPAITARLDRIPTGRVLPWIYFLEGLLFCVLAQMTHNFALAPFLVLVAAEGALGVVARALARGAVAAVLEPTGELRAGNALLNMLIAPNMAAGGALGAVLVAGLGTDAALFANAATFGLGALVLATARGLPRYSRDGDEFDPAHWRARLREAFAYPRRHPRGPGVVVGPAAG